MITLNSKSQLTVDVIAKVAGHKSLLPMPLSSSINPDVPLNAISRVIEIRDFSLLFMATPGVNRQIKRRIF